MDNPNKGPGKSRIPGYDLARAPAVMGMVLVNFKIVMGAEKAGPSWLVWLGGCLDGRAAATFVVLAGVGLSLSSQRARIANDLSRIAQNRKMLFKRALFLLVVGLLYTPIWPADILHFYGIYIALGALFLTASNRWLWGLSLTFMGISVLLVLMLDYEAEWDWETLTYSGFWTPWGMIRHLFFNGFHPVFPWTAFLFVGMWLGRRNVLDPAVRRKIFLSATAIAVLTESVSWLLVHYFSTRLHAIDAETVIALFGTKPMPPMPFYMLAGGSTAVVIITLSVALIDRFPEGRWYTPLLATGQLALTLYVAHVIFGMGILQELGLLENQTLPFALGSALIFCACAVLFSYLWKKRFNRGPLEWIMRRITG